MNYSDVLGEHFLPLTDIMISCSEGISYVPPSTNQNQTLLTNQYQGFPPKMVLAPGYSYVDRHPVPPAYATAMIQEIPQYAFENGVMSDPKVWHDVHHSLGTRALIDLTSLYEPKALSTFPHHSTVSIFEPVFSSSSPPGICVSSMFSPVTIFPTYHPSKHTVINGLLSVAHEKYDMKLYEAAYVLCMEIHEMDPFCLQNLLLLGCILFKRGLYDEALHCNSSILRVDPNFAEAYGNMGAVYRMLGNHESAMSCYRYAIHLKPYFWDAYDNMVSLCLQSSTRAVTSSSSEDTHIKYKTEHTAAAYQTLAKMLQEEHNIQGAIHTYFAALRHHANPNFFNNLGILLSQVNRLDEAILSYYHGLELDSKHVHLLTNLGSAYKEKGLLNEAIQCYLTTLDINPQFHIALINLANLYKDIGKIEQAIEKYDDVLKIIPDSPEALCNSLHARLSICDWRTRELDLTRMQTTVTKQLAANEVPSVLPFHCFIYPLEENDIRLISIRHAEKIARLISNSFTHTSLPRSPTGRLRVGYVSSDFGSHPLSHLMQGVFGMHNRKSFEIFCYATSHDDGSTYRRKIRDESEHFVDLTNLSNEEAAKRIYHDRIHILVNLNGYTKGARNEIFAARPAPLQIAYMGFPGTMGASFMHYLISDTIASPPETAHLYTEHLIYMPHTYFVTDHRQSFRSVLDPSLLPKRLDLFPHLSPDTIIFANFNQMYKIDPLIFDIWMSILRQVPDSVLWLLRFPPAAESNLLREAESRGIPNHRILFTDVAPKEDYILRNTLADIFLDTPECNGHTTAADVLWAGVPVITYPKRKMASRVCASLCEATGFGDYMVVHSYAAYEQTAIRLATDHHLRNDLRQQLRLSRETSLLFDTQRWVRHVERAYQKIWDTFEHGGMLGPVHVESCES
jgi:protein O-GlcNAc transferase